MIPPRRWGNPNTFALDFEPSPDPALAGLSHYGTLWYWIGGRRFLGDRSDPVCIGAGEMDGALAKHESGQLSAHPEFFTCAPQPFVRRVKEGIYGYHPHWLEDERRLWTSIAYCHHLAILNDAHSWHLVAAERDGMLRLACGKFVRRGRPRGSDRLVGPALDVRLPWAEFVAAANAYGEFFRTTPCIEPELTYPARTRPPTQDPPPPIPPLPKDWLLPPGPRSHRRAR